MANKNIPDDEFDKILRDLVKQFGDGYGKTGLAESNSKAIPTGHDDLDCLLTKGAHGIFLGGIIEIMGSEGSGKSSLALRTIGNAQKAGLRCCWLDAEAAFTEDIAKLNGVDPTKLILPDLANTKAAKGTGISFLNVNQVLEMIYQSVVSNVFSLIVLDSVAGLMPDRVLQAAFATDPDKVGVAEVARAMSQMLGKIAQACLKTETSVIFINQLRDQPGAWFQDRFHTPGGRALKFFAQQRISVEKKAGEDGKVYTEIDGKQEWIGHWARCTIVKNRKAPPVAGSFEIPIYYREYFPDTAQKCYDLARKLQVITMRSGVLNWKAIDLQVEGESEMLATIRDNELEPNLAAACISAAQGEKNLKLKKPITVSTTMCTLAQSATKTGKITTTKTKTKKKRPGALNLDE